MSKTTRPGDRSRAAAGRQPAGPPQGPLAVRPPRRRGGARQPAAQLPSPARDRRRPCPPRRRARTRRGVEATVVERADARPPARRGHGAPGPGAVGRAAAQARPRARLRARARPQSGAGARPDPRPAQSRRDPALRRGVRGARGGPARAGQRRARRRRRQGGIGRARYGAGGRGGQPRARPRRAGRARLLAPRPRRRRPKPPSTPSPRSTIWRSCSAPRGPACAAWSREHCDFAARLPIAPDDGQPERLGRLRHRALRAGAAATPPVSDDSAAFPKRWSGLCRHLDRRLALDALRRRPAGAPRNPTI